MCVTAVIGVTVMSLSHSQPVEPCRLSRLAYGYAASKYRPSIAPRPRVERENIKIWIHRRYTSTIQNFSTTPLLDMALHLDHVQCDPEHARALNC